LAYKVEGMVMELSKTLLD